jgi:hypothetical protein
LKGALGSDDSPTVNFSLYVGGADAAPLVKVSKSNVALSETWLPVGK